MSQVHRLDGRVVAFAYGSDAVCVDAVGLEAQWLLDYIAEDDRRRRDREDEPTSYLLAGRSGDGCSRCGDEDAPTVDGECPACRGLVGHPVDSAGYADFHAVPVGVMEGGSA